MFEYQANAITRNRYNFEAPKFFVDSSCFDDPVDRFFESVDTEMFWREIFIVQNKYAEQELWNDLWVHSVDTRVKF
jgi:hypothetical protein